MKRKEKNQFWARKISPLFIYLFFGLEISKPKGSKMNHPVKLILIKPDGTRVPLSIQVKNAFELYARMLQKCTCYGHTVVVYSFKGITPDVYSVTNVGDCQWELDSADIHAFRIGEYDE